MYQRLKSEIIEIVEIVKQCPVALQEKCFEVLLKNYLASCNTTINENYNEEVEPVNTSEQNKEQMEQTDDEITENYFHVKVQRFLKNNEINMGIINKLYYQEEERLLPLYESLKSTKMSECQIRLALLTAFENSFADEEMYFNGEKVRQRCKVMKCYDSTNFTKTFKSHSELFENWEEKYEKPKNYTLSQKGKKELSKILIDLAEDN